MTPEEPRFFVVEAFRVGADDFSVEGIFTKSEDAEELCIDLRASPQVEAVCPAQFLPMSILVDKLLRDRLGILHGALLGLEKLYRSSKSAIP